MFTYLFAMSIPTKLNPQKIYKVIMNINMKKGVTKIDGVYLMNLLAIYSNFIPFLIFLIEYISMRVKTNPKTDKVIAGARAHT